MTPLAAHHARAAELLARHGEMRRPQRTLYWRDLSGRQVLHHSIMLSLARRGYARLEGRRPCVAYPAEPVR